MSCAAPGRDVRPEVDPIRDAVFLPAEEEFLLATESGLRRWNPGAAASAAGIALPEDESISRLVVDDRGRLWLGGHSLYVVASPTGPALEVSDFLPVKGPACTALCRDPEHADGLFAGSGRFGLLRIRLPH